MKRNAATRQGFCRKQSIVQSSANCIVTCFHVQLRSNNRDLRAISEINNRIALEQQGLSSFNSDYAQSCFGTDANCFETDYRHVEPHVLFWFGDFNHNCAFPRQCAAALDGLACSFESFNRNDGSIPDDNGLPDVEA